MVSSSRHRPWSAITPRSKWLLLNTPGNPAGAMYDADELRALARVLDRHPHVWLMTDEIYEHLAYGGARHVSPSPPRRRWRTERW